MIGEILISFNVLILFLFTQNNNHEVQDGAATAANVVVAVTVAGHIVMLVVLMV